MGSKITVQSEVGQGSMFEFAIPVEITTPPALPPETRCLVGDDRNRPSLLALLQSLGYRIREATRGEEIVVLWKTSQPHLIWLELQIPASIDALRQIRALGGNPPPVILAIGDAEAQSIAQAAGCNDFLVRPLHETQVRLTLKKYLDSNYQTDAAPVAAANLTHLRQQLALVPNSWIAKLHQASLEGDRDWMLSLVAEMRSQHESLAETIASLANHFQYVQLLTLTQPIQPPEPTI